MFALLRRPGRALSVVCALAVAAPLYAQTATAPQAAAKPAADLPSAESIVERHIEASGGKKALEGVNSIHMKGTMTVPANGMSGSIHLYAARPNKMLVKTTIAGIGDSVEGFDGKTAWTNSPMTGPMLITGDQLKQRMNDADFNTMLNPSSRYTAMKTIEKTTFDGKEVYKLSMTRKEGGENDIDFYDVATGLKAGSITSRITPMGTIQSTTTLSDYKKVGDIMQPMTMKQSITGIDIVTTFDTVEFNKVDAAVFELPAEIKALIK